MTAQQVLPMSMAPGAVRVGAAADLLEDGRGGEVFLHGNLTYAWSGQDQALRRLTAVQLIELGVAKVGEVADAFGVDTATLWRWRREFAGAGVGGLVPDKRGPKGASKLTPSVIGDIRARRAAGASLRAVAAATGLSTGSVRRALTPDTLELDHQDVGDAQGLARVVDLPVLAAPAARTTDRVAARWGGIECAGPVFTPAARVPLAGLFLALPALAATGLLSCANEVYRLPGGFYGLDTMLVEGVLRALAGEPRAEGATRINPTDLGRVLGLDRAPEVKTIRRKIAQLAQVGAAGELQAAIARHHLSRGDADVAQVGVVLYVDGHVRAYQGTKRIGKAHLSRLRFPAPATVETWVAGGDGGPVLVVMSEPGASLAGELARLLPELRTAVGDDRRVLVGFDRGGWSPALFAHMAAAGFDPLTWRKATTPDLDAEAFTEVTFTGETGRQYTWALADTVVDVPIDDHGGVFTMRQVTRWDTKKTTPRQVHVLTTRTDLDAAQVIYRMGARWRLENYFRYARMHFDLDAHHAYASTDDDPHRLVPNPAKRAAHLDVATARARYDRAQGRTDAAMLAARSPAPGTQAILTNQVHDAITADLRAAETDLATAQQTHKTIPTRVPLGQLHPGQQVLDVETKLITHAIGAAAFNTINALARDIRLDTGYARANHEAHTLARQVLTHSGDIDPGNGHLTVRLDPMPTARATTAIRELCAHLTATQTRYPSTDLILRYEIKTRP
ncbi:MAG: helix-turn-helix domain-containing protein [Phycicoccus sp.]|nr:helix-turn-helix domain-containing protein [Phycicoccus sp.]